MAGNGRRHGRHQPSRTGANRHSLPVSDESALRDDLAELRREQQAAGEREAALRDVIQTIARTTFDLDAVLQTVIDRAVRLCRADNGNIARHDGDVYRVVAFTSFSPEYEHLVRERVYVPERGSVIGRALLEKAVVQIPDVLDDPEYELLDVQKAGGYRSILAVPMLRDDTTIGAIAMGRNEVHPFSDAEIQLIETFADQVAIAIENVRLFQTVERQRLELARFAPAGRPTCSRARRASSSSPVTGARSRRSSATCAASPRSPRRPSRRRCSVCCASTTRPWASSWCKTAGRSSTSRATG